MLPLLSAFEQAWFIALLVVWAGLLFGGFLWGKPNLERRGRMPAWTRLSSSLVLVVAGWSWYSVARGTTTATFALLIAIGMTLGLVGDLFMAKVLPVSGHVLWGMASFGLGHVAYIAACILWGNHHGLAAPWPRYASWSVWLAVGALGWYFAVFRRSAPGTRSALHWAALPYALLLASTAGAATGLAVQEPSLWLIAVGAMLFLLSDLILAGRRFGNLDFPLIDDAIWLTYGPAQMCIVYSIGAAMRLSGM